MSVTRDNHYVPKWYQKRFLEPGRGTLAYLDTSPPQEVLVDGRVVTERSMFDGPPSRCFRQTDLYSTFFGTSVNDEIERRLFGAIDVRGSSAARAFTGADESEWHRHFQSLFEYIDIQKIRTPKGLDWLKAQYPELSQNDLMIEMQGIRMMHCTLWTEGVREIVSAEDADLKFIVSDHPATIYNHALAPDSAMCVYPNDPNIALKASQTIFPLSRDHCLILTNLEYAQDPACSPIEKRTFARNFRTSLVSTIAFIRSRKLTGRQVAQINHILKSRARRYIAAGREEWLYPETMVAEPWNELRDTLAPPKNELGHFGGEIYASFEDGHVHYQDAFGRTEKEREVLIKQLPTREPRPSEACRCGSGQTYKACCKSLPTALRPAWDQLSIRERNLTLYRGIADILGFDRGKDWVAIRRELTDEQISRIYVLYEALWPLETDLLKLLPKPDGRSRAVYTGSLHPEAITEFAFGASLYFGELLIEHPFVHAGIFVEKFNPVEHPNIYHMEFLQAVALFLNIMPLVDLGVVNLVPDPGTFDAHLRAQTLQMARDRSAGIPVRPSQEPRLERLMKLDYRRDFLMMPRDGMLARLRADFPDMSAEEIHESFLAIERMKEHDPLAPLQDGLMGGDSGGQFRLMKLAPNFEMAMYLAQATGASIVTDSAYRWRELHRALRPRGSAPVANLRALAHEIASATFLFPADCIEIAKLAFGGELKAYSTLLRDSFEYLARLAKRGVKPNWEAHLAARFTSAHQAGQAVINKSGASGTVGRITCAFPVGGIQDHTVNRLLLMSSSEHHLPSVPSAYFISNPIDPAQGQNVLRRR